MKLNFPASKEIRSKLRLGDQNETLLRDIKGHRSIQDEQCQLLSPLEQNGQAESLKRKRSAPSQAAAAGGPPGGPGNPGDGGPTQPVNTTSNRRLQQTQAQVDEVVDIMRVNVDKVLERDQKLSELDDRADALQAGASQFETSAAKLKRKYWWKNCKMVIILGAICAFIIIVIISKYLYWNT
ncbi:vesicle-associated membrane protein 2-like [Carcharodon carcharias]|uniref:vesicle-associated membrane protein 2-like n=1 Tax=Carcharodon carcharias TaxID=13397 RepID=UPI001B7DB414|nr:vesicle-associated membrane protein 2-like [Carcharodon carcharias]